MSLAMLEQIMKRPSLVRDTWSPDRWKAVEEKLGTRFPEDYKGFVEAFGAGTINDFLVVLVPLSSSPYVDLLKRGQSELRAYEASKSKFPKLFRDNIYPTPGGILPFAVTDNGEVLFWRTVGVPDKWTVTVYESRGPKNFDFEGGMAGFLVGVLTGKIECNVLPKDFSNSPTIFKPIGLSGR